MRALAPTMSAKSVLHVWASDIQLLRHGCCAKLCNRLYLHRRIVNLGSLGRSEMGFRGDLDRCAQVPVLQDVHRSLPRSPCHPLRPGTGSGTALVPCCLSPAPKKRQRQFGSSRSTCILWSRKHPCELMCIIDHCCAFMFAIDSILFVFLPCCQFANSGIVMYRHRNTLGNTR